MDFRILFCVVHVLDGVDFVKPFFNFVWPWFICECMDFHVYMFTMLLITWKTTNKIVLYIVKSSSYGRRIMQYSGGSRVLSFCIYIVGSSIMKIYLYYFFIYTSMPLPWFVRWSILKYHISIIIQTTFLKFHLTLHWHWYSVILCWVFFFTTSIPGIMS